MNKLEARVGIEPTNKGFADLDPTTSADLSLLIGWRSIGDPAHRVPALAAGNVPAPESIA